jgi:murein endopeptidase
MPILERLSATTTLSEGIAALLIETTLIDRLLGVQLTEPLTWTMPHQATWPTNDAGVPLVTSPRTQEMWHTITSRRDLDWVFDRYKVKRATLERWNPNLDLMTLEAGDELVTWRSEPDTIARGRGTPNRGRLLDGVPLPPADKYVIMHPHRAFGTYYITSTLKTLFDAYALSHPEASPVIVGDLSYRTGRRIKPHLSHQSGRDVDITYPRHDEPKNYLKFHRIRRKNLDAERTLWLVREMIATGYIERVFMDYWVQRAVYKEAERQGAPQAWLDAVFQYPGWSGEAFLQRAKGHDDHMHVRFFCQPTDVRCRNR